ncbi:Pyruvate/Phosphoenolpyruvate kinase-like domain-containing protein [Delphinella strobiligena]|nr:Pyruvate/Phosphoenolpyruvate kinase-like domain-containing protein [Delphinella strobiligena]
MASQTPTKPTGAAKLRELLKDPKHIVVAPGVYDGLTARLVLAQDFECLYMTGAGTNMSKLGTADLGIATMNDMIQNASMIVSLSPSTPVIADADTGYGGPIMVARTVRSYALAGIAALHIEGQVQEKRCGHLSGKQLVDRSTYYSRLRAAVKARDDCGSDMLIIARTDARADAGFDEAVERLKGAVACGVDAVFLEALQSREECEETVRIFEGVPVLLNMARECGFRIFINPTLTLETVVRPLERALRLFREEGRDECEPIGPNALFRICGLDDAMAFDESVGGKASGKK